MLDFKEKYKVEIIVLFSIDLFCKFLKISTQRRLTEMLIERFLINYVGSGARELFPLEDSFNFYWLLWVPVYLCVCVCVSVRVCVSVCVCLCADMYHLEDGLSSIFHKCKIVQDNFIRVIQ